METTSPEVIRQAKNIPFNFIANLLDGGFFGMALGFASLTTVIPLFVSQLTHSAILISLIPAIHIMGWQLPQIFTAQRVAQQKRYKPMVMFFTIQERLPFLGLAVVAWFIPKIGPTVALVVIFLLLVWQGIGGGLAANAWQNMIGKIIPRERWGLFYGLQGSASYLLGSVGAVIAGEVLDHNPPNTGFTICFLLAVGAFIVSYIAISFTREQASEPVNNQTGRKVFWNEVRLIFLRDGNFRWFVGARILAQLGTMGFALYTVYIVRFYSVDVATAGVLTAVMMIVETIFNPIMGWLGDRWSHRWVMAIGMAAAAVSAIIAWKAPSVGWFYLVYALAGIANIAVWTIAMAMTLEYGKGHEKPAYIGLSNTLIAPTGLIILLSGGWLADTIGYQATFIATATGAILTVLVLSLVLHDHPRINLISA